MLNRNVRAKVSGETIAANHIGRRTMKTTTHNPLIPYSFSALLSAWILAVILVWMAPSAAQARPSKFFLVAKGGRGAKAWTLYRGNRLRNAADLRWLKKHGITRIVALENFNHKSLMRAAKRLGMEYLPRFMSRGAPRDMGRKLFGPDVTDDLVKPGTGTYVYCTHGVHRTGGVVARFRAEQGWQCKPILKEAAHFGFTRIYYRKYHWLLDWVMKRCRANEKAAKASTSNGSTGTTK